MANISKKSPATGSGEPEVPTNPGQYSAAALETQHGQYRMLSDLNASVAVLRESVNLLRDEVKSNAQKVETKLDTHSGEIRALMIEVQSYARSVKVLGGLITLFLAILAFLWAVGSKILEWLVKK